MNQSTQNTSINNQGQDFQEVRGVTLGFWIEGMAINIKMLTVYTYSQHLNGRNYFKTNVNIYVSTYFSLY